MTDKEMINHHLSEAFRLASDNSLIGKYHTDKPKKWRVEVETRFCLKNRKESSDFEETSDKPTCKNDKKISIKTNV